MRFIGDSGGGLLANTGHEIVQVGGAVYWRYDSPDSLEMHVAQGGDGTVFAVEYSNQFLPDSSLLALDGSTGDPIWRIALPTSQDETDNQDCESWRLPNVNESRADVGAPSVDQDGNAWMQVRHYRRFFDYLPCGTGYWELEETLQLLRVTPSGDATWVMLHHDSVSGTPDGTGVGGGLPGRTIVADSGDLLATWNYQQVYTFPNINEARATPVNGSIVSAGTSQIVATSTWWDGSGLVIGEGGQAYGNVGSALVSLDVGTGAINWNQPISTLNQLVSSTSGGGVAVNRDGGMAFLDSLGSAISTANVSGLQRGSGLWIKVADDYTGVIADAGPLLAEANVGWNAPDGNDRGQSSVWLPYLTNVSGETLIVKQEKCGVGFDSVPNNTKYNRPVDGVLAPSDSSVWYKISNGVRVVVAPLPVRPVKYWGLLSVVGDCDWDQACALVPVVYEHSGGYKQEPAWSTRFWDWKYPPDPGYESGAPLRVAKCGPEK